MGSICKLRVRTYECDSYNHVNNANYLNYLEYARYEFLRDIGFDFKALTLAGFFVYTVRIEIDYKKSAIADDELLIETLPLKKGAVSGVLQQKITRGEEIISLAKVTWAIVDKRGVPTKLPKEFDLPGLAPSS